MTCSVVKIAETPLRTVLGLSPRDTVEQPEQHGRVHLPRGGSMEFIDLGEPPTSQSVGAKAARLGWLMSQRPGLELGHLVERRRDPNRLAHEVNHRPTGVQRHDSTQPICVVRDPVIDRIGLDHHRGLRLEGAAGVPRTRISRCCCHTQVCAPGGGCAQAVIGLFPGDVRGQRPHVQSRVGPAAQEVDPFTDVREIQQQLRAAGIAFTVEADEARLRAFTPRRRRPARVPCAAGPPASCGPCVPAVGAVPRSRCSSSRGAAAGAGRCRA